MSLSSSFSVVSLRNAMGFGCNGVFALVELLDEFLHAVLVIKFLRLAVRLPLVRENNLQTRIQKRQFAQPLADDDPP